MSRWRRRARRLLRRALPPRPGAVILGYHRIAEPTSCPGGDPYRMCVSPAAFRDQMASLRDVGRPVSLEHLVHAAQGGVPVEGMIAVTFDDGYAELLTSALPVLERYEIPATVFFVSGAAGRVFWWDRLTAQLADADPAVPIRVPTGTSEFLWPGVGSFDELRVRLHRVLRTLDDDDRDETLERLAAAWEHETPELPRALSLDEARRLTRSAWIRPGSHSMSHPPLAEVDPQRAETEIGRSRERLEEELECRVQLFSYPHGSRSATTDRLVRAAGYEAACISSQDSVRRDTDPFALPRVWATDRAGRSFRRRIVRYAGTRGAGVAWR